MEDLMTEIVVEQEPIHFDCLDWAGLPSILCGVLRAAGYAIPPHYTVQEFVEH